MPPAIPAPTFGPEISVIVPHLNQPELLAAFLASLEAQDFDMGRAEVIVVDNGSRRKPHEVVARFPGVVLVEEPVPGPGPARNRGAALARGPILAFTDADCLAAPDWLPAILARFAADPDLAILGGDIRIFAEHPERPTLAEAYECVYAFPQRDYITRQGFSVTANLAMRRAIFDAVGPFAGIAIAEDTDWGQRAGRLGHATIYAPEVVVRHPARRSMTDLRAKWERHIGHHYTAFAQGPGGRAKWTLKAAALVVSPLAQIPRLARTDRLGAPRDRILAFCALATLRFYRGRRMLAVMLDRDTRTAETRWNRQ